MMGHPKIQRHLDKSGPPVPHPQDALALCVSETRSVKAKASHSVSYVATISVAPLAMACVSIRTFLARVKALVVSRVNRSTIEQRVTVYPSQPNAFRQRDLVWLTSLTLENLMMRLGNRQNDEITLRVDIWAT